MLRVRITMIALGVACLAQAASAQTSNAPVNRLSLGLGQGTADGYATTTVGASEYLAPSTRPETNVNAEYWRSLGEHTSLALSGAYGFSSMNWKGADPGDPEIDATGTSFKARLGVDRVGKVSDRLQVFLGPGVEYWTGKEKLKVAGAETESESVNRFGVSGRIGGFMMISETVGIMGQVGHTFGIAKADDSGGAKTSWWPNSFQASWGLAFGF